MAGSPKGIDDVPPDRGHLMSDSMLRRAPLVLGIGLLVVIVATVASEPRSGGAGFWFFVVIGGAMADRSAAFGDDLTIESAPGAGTHVVVTIATEARS